LPKVTRPTISRRALLGGALAGGALVVGWKLWPRHYVPNLAAAPGEEIFNPYVKIGRDGHVTVIAPQTELGQGSYTIVAQIVADELGADWRTIAVEPAPVSPFYANPLLAGQWKSGRMPGSAFQGTGGSTTLRAFLLPLREAAAAARIMLCKAAGDHWDASWEACDTEDGFVIRGKDRLRFGVLVEEAADKSVPNPVPLRIGGKRIAGRGVNRLDVAAKLDGSATFTADVRLPDMVFAAIRQGPIGDSKLLSVDRKAADAIPGVMNVVENPHWVAAVANNWWAANRALDAMKPRFATSGGLVDDASVAKALETALKTDGSRIYETGDPNTALGSGRPVLRQYDAGFALHHALEPMAAAASIENDHMQLWIATQLPGAARAAAARATGMSEDAITVHVMQAGGAFGRKYEVEAAGQAALLAQKLSRPVNLLWSRAEDVMQDRFRPAARAVMSAKLGRARVEAVRAQIATADAVAEVKARNLVGVAAHDALADTASPLAVEGAYPPYAIAAIAVDHHPALLRVATGKLRGGAGGFNCFFLESFIDECARETGVDPFSFRMGMLGGQPRLAACLTKVAARGGWEGGGTGTAQGVACHMMQGSYVAVMAEASIGDDQRIKVSKLVAVADIGAIMNPDIARQQIEGALMHGMALAIGGPVHITRGMAGPRNLGAYRLPRLIDMPEVSVELIVSGEEPGGLGELALPPVAPAIANAIASGTGKRLRSLPLLAAPT
jgi:isoquinoline 1-oxidoreductase subunit beta